MQLGVCYYPEQWPRAWWADDARRMVETGIALVRIGEFAWSRIEPEPGRFDWDWLDAAVETLHAAGLKVVMGTPTATPPKWLVDRLPDMLAVDASGRPRRFGSRRHYCFSHEGYRAECARIVEAMARRYGDHPAVTAWQTDNEYGCHDTTISYSAAAAERFRLWLARRYGDVATLNAAWGGVFWSQDYRAFDEIDPPNLTVTEANPSHRLDYNRFASDEVVSFNRLQVDILRRHSPGRDITHNFMGFYTEFDHFAVGRDLDVATWDSYPLGFLEQFWFSPEDKARYLRQGHPDIAAFHHDLYRGCGQGRWWVMEQQPGPVNWAGFNPAPLPGMVRAWTWEAFAHGAEVVSYFRWRQAPFAQEQMHAGLNRPDRTEDTGGREARQVSADLARVGDPGPRGPSPVALVFSYEGDWVTGIQPQGQGFRALKEAFAWYSALRRRGLDVDIVPPGAELSAYALVVAPCLPIASPQALAAFEACGAVIVFGARAGSKTRDLHIPAGLPPGDLSALLPMRVLRVESLRPGTPLPVTTAAGVFAGEAWREDVETDALVLGRFDDGGPAWLRSGRCDYLACSPDAALLDVVLADAADRAGLATALLAEGVRVSRRGDLVLAVNYAPELRLAPAPDDAVFLVGGRELPPAGVSIWRPG
jgi:beta-galactosidase